MEHKNNEVIPTSHKSNLCDDVKKLVKNYNDNKDKILQDKNKIENERDAKLSENRQKGCDDLYEHILSQLHDKVKTYAGYGRNEARIFEFKFKDELKFGNCYAKDLLTKGDVISRVQQYLDKEHYDEQGPAFFVYFTHIGHYQKDHAENKYGVFVNWDKNSWPIIKEKLAAKTSMINRTHDLKEKPVQYKRGGGRYKGYRGGFHNGYHGGFRGGYDGFRGGDPVARCTQNITPQSKTTPPTQNSPLPESHSE